MFPKMNTAAITLTICLISALSLIAKANPSQQFPLDAQTSERLYKSMVVNNLKPASDSDMMTVFESSIICFSAKQDAVPGHHGNTVPSPQTYNCTVMPID